MNFVKFKEKLIDKNIIIEQERNQLLTLRLEVKVEKVDIRKLFNATQDKQLTINGNIILYFDSLKLSPYEDNILEMHVNNEIIGYINLNENDSWADIFDKNNFTVYNNDLKDFLFRMLKEFKCDDCDLKLQEIQKDCRIVDCVFIKAAQAIKF